MPPVHFEDCRYQSGTATKDEETVYFWKATSSFGDQIFSGYGANSSSEVALALARAELHERAVHYNWAPRVHAAPGPSIPVAAFFPARPSSSPIQTVPASLASGLDEFIDLELVSFRAKWERFPGCSNGVAFHFDRGRSIQLAAKEVLERHFLSAFSHRLQFVSPERIVFSMNGHMRETTVKCRSWQCQGGTQLHLAVALDFPLWGASFDSDETNGSTRAMSELLINYWNCFEAKEETIPSQQASLRMPDNDEFDYYNLACELFPRTTVVELDESKIGFVCRVISPFARLDWIDPRRTPMSISIERLWNERNTVRLRR